MHLVAVEVDEFFKRIFGIGKPSKYEFIESVSQKTFDMLQDFQRMSESEIKAKVT